MNEDIKKYIIQNMIKQIDLENLFLKMIDEYDRKISLINALTNFIIKRSPKLENQRLVIFGQCALKLDETLKQNKSLNAVSDFFKSTVIEISKILGKNENIVIEDEDTNIEINEEQEEIKKRKYIRKENKINHIIVPSKEEIENSKVIEREANKSESPEERARKFGIKINDSLGSLSLVKKNEKGEKESSTRTKDLALIARNAADKVKEFNPRENRNIIQ